MPGEKVHRSPLPADPEGDLCSNLPARGTKERRDEFDELRVIGIEQAVEGFAVPAQAEIGPGPEHACEALHLRERDVPGLTRLDANHDRSTDPRRDRQIVLTQAAATPKRTNPASEPDEVHRSES